jgi:hypothetical protein
MLKRAMCARSLVQKAFVRILARDEALPILRDQHLLA